MPTNVSCSNVPIGNRSGTWRIKHYTENFINVVFSSMPRNASIDEKTTLIRHHLYLSVQTPLLRGEFLNESWQFYIVLETVEKLKKSCTHFSCGKLKKSFSYGSIFVFLLFVPPCKTDNFRIKFHLTTEISDKQVRCLIHVVF